MATILRKHDYIGGTEGFLHGMATFLLIITIVPAVICFVWAIFDVSGWLWFAIGVGLMAQCLIVFAVLRGQAEMIRLLKKQNGLPFSGKISDTKPGVEYRVCSECGHKLFYSEDKCMGCGEVFVRMNQEGAGKAEMRVRDF